MGHTSMSQFRTGWSHFSRLMVTVDYDCVSTKNYDYCPQSFSGGGLYLNGSWLLWSVYDGLLWYIYGSYEHVPISYGVVTLFKANGYCRL